MQDGNAVLNGTDQGLGRDELKSRLDDSKKRWEEVKRNTEKRSSEIDELYPKSKSFYDNAVTFSCWLMNAEKLKESLANVELTAEKDVIAQRDLHIQVFVTLCLLLSPGSICMSRILTMMDACDTSHTPIAHDPF